MFHHLFLKNIVTRTAIGKESLTALHLNCGKNLTGNKIKFRLGEKKITWHPCCNIQPWLISWNICCCRVVLVWQTIDDRVGCWDMDNGHRRIIFQMDIYIHIRWWYWSHIPQVIIIPETRYYNYCSWRQMLLFRPDIEYYCWVAEVIYSSWVPD